MRLSAACRWVLSAGLAEDDAKRGSRHCCRGDGAALAGNPNLLRSPLWVRSRERSCARRSAASRALTRASLPSAEL